MRSPALQAYWERLRARARAGEFIGLCDCGERAVKLQGGNKVCQRCARMEASNFAGELARGVCGYVARGRLAREVNT